MVVGLVKATAHIGLGEDSLREVEFLVDTGSLFTFLPREIADDLGITFPVTSRVITADSRAIEAPIGLAYLRLMDREGGIIVASMPDGLDVPLPLLGATALQTLGLKVNPVDETLEHYLPFGPALL